MPVPNMTNVDSSNIESVAYIDGDESIVIKFKAGKYYKYKASRQIYEELIKAPSVGKFFNAYIKNKCEFQELIPD